MDVILLLQRQCDRRTSSNGLIIIINYALTGSSNQVTKWPSVSAER
jgi:hypothetical protein